jgi:hypothetical protein
MELIAVPQVYAVLSWLICQCIIAWYPVVLLQPGVDQVACLSNVQCRPESTHRGYCILSLSSVPGHPWLTNHIAGSCPSSRSSWFAFHQGKSVFSFGQFWMMWDWGWGLVLSYQLWSSLYTLSSRKNFVVLKFNISSNHRHNRTVCCRIFSNAQGFFLQSSVHMHACCKIICQIQSIWWHPFRWKPSASHGLPRSIVAIQYSFQCIYGREPQSTTLFCHWFSQFKTQNQNTAALQVFKYADFMLMKLVLD